jgi:hypothetical protein
MKGFESPAKEARSLLERVRTFLFKRSVEEGQLPYEDLKVSINLYMCK